LKIVIFKNELIHSIEFSLRNFIEHQVLVALHILAKDWSSILGLDIIFIFSTRFQKISVADHLSACT
jgi:hypothetical protein